jgi:AcrR family transcriptional regulator
MPLPEAIQVGALSSVVGCPPNKTDDAWALYYMSTDQAGRRVRLDANLNRARILEAAFPVLGQDAYAPLDRVVRASGMGRSTFFRHFPDREALLAAMVEQSVEDLASEVQAAAQTPDGLRRVLQNLTERVIARAGFVDYWMAADPKHPVTLSALEAAAKVLDGMVNAAGQAGQCRSDLRASDRIALQSDAGRRASRCRHCEAQGGS